MLVTELTFMKRYLDWKTGNWIPRSSYLSLRWRPLKMNPFISIKERASQFEILWLKLSAFKNILDILVKELMFQDDISWLNDWVWSKVCCIVRHLKMKRSGSRCESDTTKQNVQIDLLSVVFIIESSKLTWEKMQDKLTMVLRRIQIMLNRRSCCTEMKHDISWLKLPLPSNFPEALPASYLYERCYHFHCIMIRKEVQKARENGYLAKHEKDRKNSQYEQRLP